MKNIAIVCEYNPFHNGHAKQLASLRERGNIICLMSGNYVQRGEPAVADKLTRAKAAVLCGADAVLELPLTYAVRSAEGFADGAVDILTRLGCVDAMAFGCEEVDGNKIMSTAKALLRPDFPATLKAELAEGCSFPTARDRALLRLDGALSAPKTPNDILAVEYCKALLRRDSEIRPILQHREGDYHFGDDPQNPSASFLRAREDWADYVPQAAWDVFRQSPRYSLAAGERAWLARLRSLTDEEFEALPYGGEGLWRKVAAACRTEATLADIVAAAKSKRYTRTRLMRLLLCAYLGVSREMLEADAPYVRVLAFNERGRQFLRAAKSNGDIPLVNAGATPPDEAYWRLEQRAAALHGLFRRDAPHPPQAERTARLCHVKE